MAEQARANDRKISMMTEAIRAARGPQEKRPILGSMSKVITAEALTAVVSQLADAEITERAGSAAIAIVRKMKGRDTDTVKQALQQVLEHVESADTRKAASDLLAGL
jgi:hypothetical protein